MSASSPRIYLLFSFVEAILTFSPFSPSCGGALLLLRLLVPRVAFRARVAVLLPAVLRRVALSFRAGPVRVPLALRVDPLAHLLLDGIDVVDAHEAHVLVPEAERRRDLRRL